MGAYPSADPVTPGDLAATIFGCFGLERRRGARPERRPYRLAEGEVLRKLFT